jgi:hypothetical protein
MIANTTRISIRIDQIFIAFLSLIAAIYLIGKAYGRSNAIPGPPRRIERRLEPGPARAATPVTAGGVVSDDGAFQCGCAIAWFHRDG